MEFYSGNVSRILQHAHTQKSGYISLSILVIKNYMQFPETEIIEGKTKQYRKIGSSLTDVMNHDMRFC